MSLRLLEGLCPPSCHTPSLSGLSLLIYSRFLLFRHATLAYVKFQLEEELMEERMRQPKNNVERLFRKMESDIREEEVEVYRQFLFEENGLEPYEDPSSHPELDCREGHAQCHLTDECSRVRQNKRRNE